MENKNLKEPDKTALALRKKQELFDDSTLCKMLDVDPRTTAKMRERREINFFRYQGRILYSRKYLRDFLKKNRVPVNPKYLEIWKD